MWQGLVLGWNFFQEPFHDVSGSRSFQLRHVVQQNAVFQHGTDDGLHVFKGAEGASLAQGTRLGGGGQSQGCLLYTSDAADEH